MIPPHLLNKLLVSIAKKLKISPGVAHVLLLLLMTMMTIGFRYSNSDYWRVISDPIFLIVWFGICTFVVLITWLTKGEYRKIWWQVKPWQGNSPVKQ